MVVHQVRAELTERLLEHEPSRDSVCNSSRLPRRPPPLPGSSGPRSSRLDWGDWGEIKPA